MKETINLARLFAESDADEQAKLFNEFSRMLQLACCGKQDNQLYYISRFLDRDGQLLIEELAKYVKIRREQAA